jgi:gamma-glutamyl hercynylcysteine S-oxide synthase
MAVLQFPLFALRVPGVTMRTRGRAGETMRELNGSGSLVEALRDAREYTLALCAHDDAGSRDFPYLESINPPLWELAHVAWFQEFWCLRHSRDDPAGAQHASLVVDADARFDSSRIAHRDRWASGLTDRGEVMRFLEATQAKVLERLAASGEDDRYFFRLALLHEDMHGEAFLMARQTLGLAAPRIAANPSPRSVAVRQREVRFSGGEFLQGAGPDSRDFIFDNEKWGHIASVRPFAIATEPVTQGDFIAFVEEGGYRREEFWSPQGRAWRDAGHVCVPRSWSREGNRWTRRWFDATEDVDPLSPMVHVNAHEAEAWCRWAERRLPTEAEWEYAARSGGKDERFPWGDTLAGESPALDLRHGSPSSALDDALPSRTGMRQLLGGVWEWTATTFDPYPGFAPDPYRDYSQPWFGTHRVLRGGSFATRSRLVHNRWRNFYLPHRRDVFAGFRTCALEA